MSKKRILFLRPSLAHGGADKVTVQLLNHLDRDKYEAELALMHTNGEMQSQLKTGVKVHDLKASSLWFCIQPIAKLLKKSDFDVIYSTSGGMSIPMMLASQLAGFKGITVVSERSSLRRFSSSKFKKEALLFFKKRVYKKASFVTCVSKALGGEIEEILEVDKSKIRVVNNPLVDSEFANKCDAEVSDFNYSKFDFNAVAVGRFVALKDYPTMLKAFQLFQQKFNNVSLTILGKGPLKAEIWKRVEEMNLQENVFFLGFHSNPYRYMAKADVLLLTSKFEGMPGVLIQSLAAGVPCISTDCPTGPNEIIQHGENGFLCPVGDHTQIAEYLEQLHTDKTLASLMKSKSKPSVKRFSTEEAISSYFSFL